MYLEPQICCPTVLINGALNTFLNQNYVFDNTLAQGRPLYVDATSTYAIWWDGEDDWMVGELSEMNEGKLSYGWIYSREPHDCPNNSSTWMEYYNGQWSYYHSRPEPLTVQCSGMFLFLVT